MIAQPLLRFGFGIKSKAGKDTENMAENQSGAVVPHSKVRPEPPDKDINYSNAILQLFAYFKIANRY